MNNKKINLSLSKTLLAETERLKNNSNALVVLNFIAPEERNVNSSKIRFHYLFKAPEERHVRNMSLPRAKYGFFFSFLLTFRLPKNQDRLSGPFKTKL